MSWSPAKTWLCIYLFSLPVFLTFRGAGISVLEVAIGGTHYLAIVLWMTWQLANGKKLVRSWQDYLLLLFVVITPLNAIVAIINGVAIPDWIAEYSMFLLIVYYFPIRETFGKDEQSVRQLFVILGILSIVFVIVGIVDYMHRLSDGFVYAYQLQASRSVLLGPVFTFVLLFAIPAYFTLKSRRKKLFVLMVIAANAVGLLQTFTRSMWASFLLCAILLMFFFNKKQNTQLVVGSLLLAATLYGGAWIYNPRLTRIASKVVASRFLTTGQLRGGDRSMDTRFVEAKAAIRELRGNYLAGNGLRYEFVSYDPVTITHVKHTFIHIGYLSIIFKIGVPLALLYFSFLALAARRAILIGINHKKFGQDSPYRVMALGTFVSIPPTLVLVFMAGFIDQRYGNVLFGILLALIAMSYDKLQQIKSTNEEIKSAPQGT